MDEWAKEDKLLAPAEVLHEIAKKEDDLHKWLKARPHFFRPLDEPVQVAVREILNRFPRLVDTKKGRDGADPFVIAQAQVSSAIAVTQEEPRPRSQSPSIPDVCEALGVKWIDFPGLIEVMGLKL
jgi:hypothetical protein